MAFHVSREGLDGEYRVNFDSLGKLYISIAIVWTTIVVCGSGFLLYHRDLPTLRVRNTHLWTTAVAFLHAYWVLCVLAYVLNGTYPCAAEFCIMSFWLPLGIALYQVNGMHLLHIATLQTRFMQPKALYAYRGSRSRKSGWRSLRNIGLPDSLSRVQKTCILVGVILQVLVSLVIFFISRKFHPSWGAIGHAVGPQQCRRGWEWVLSIVWQFFWSWCYAPYLLWKIRKIHDVHGWRLQTTICCIAGLLGSPMWLLALYSPEYSPGLARASRYFVPPLWFTPGIVAIEISVIFIPCIIVVRSRKLQKETIKQLIDWERNPASGTSVDTGSTYVPTLDDFRVPSPAPSTAPIRNELYSMKALDKALATNISPLLRFSALKDFSGENISFLKHVHDWKATWTAAFSRPALPPRFAFIKRSTPAPPFLDADSLRRQQFSFAVEIYVSFISPQYSDFPINISYPQLKDLESIFEHAASTLNAPIQENPATPFDSFPCPHSEEDVEHHASDGSIDAAAVSPTPSREKDTVSLASTAVNATSPIASSTTTYTITNTNKLYNTTANGTSDLTDLPTSSLLELKPRLSTEIAIPLSFGPHVFDEAERAIKYVVLTNTWPKFVAAGFASKGDRERGRCKERRAAGGEKGGYGGWEGEGDRVGWVRWLWGGGKKYGFD